METKSATPPPSPRKQIIPAGQPLPPAERLHSVRLVGVSKTYGTGKEALIDVDLVIPEGDFVFLVGPSGAGKSTLIKLLVRDEKATAGSVEVAGHDLGRMKKKEVPLLRRKIGIVELRAERGHRSTRLAVQNDIDVCIDRAGCNRTAFIFNRFQLPSSEHVNFIVPGNRSEKAG